MRCIYFGFATFALLIGTVFCSAQGFRLYRTEQKCPEYGTITTQHVLDAGTNRFTFTAPPDWQIKVENANQRVLFTAPNYDSTITFRVVSNPSITNTIWPAASTNLTSQKRAEPRDRILQSLPKARITSEFESPFAGSHGRSCCYQFADAAGRPGNGRMGVFPFPSCEAEIGFATVGNLNNRQLDYFMILRTLNHTNIKP